MWECHQVGRYVAHQAYLTEVSAYELIQERCRMAGKTWVGLSRSGAGLVVTGLLLNPWGPVSASSCPRDQQNFQLYTGYVYSHPESILTTTVSNKDYAYHGYNMAVERQAIIMLVGSYQM